MKTIAKLLGRRQITAMPEPQNTPAFLGDAGADFRTLKATLPGIEFGAVQWAAKRTMHKAANGQTGPMPMADFFRLALLEKLREVVKAEIAKGKAIPPDIAAVIDERRKP